MTGGKRISKIGQNAANPVFFYSPCIYMCVYTFAAYGQFLLVKL